MRRGLLVVNAFLQLPKFNAIYAALVASAQRSHIQLTIVSNAFIATHIEDPQFLEQLPDFVLFWDKDVKTARLLEQLQIPVFNSADGILKCDDKSLTYLALKQADIPMPKTIIIPKTFANIGYTTTDFLDDAVHMLGFPLILKECFGSFGKQVYIFHDIQSLRAKVIALGATPMILQSMAIKSFGRDLRINIVGGKIVASIYRHNENGDFRSNITQGGSMQPYTPTKEEAQLALRAVQVLGLAFAGVDVLFGDNGPLICEVNSNAHFQTTLECTGVNMADAIFSFITQKIG